MSTPTKLRQKFLSEAAVFILDEYIGAAKGDSKFKSNSATAREELWELVKAVIQGSDDPTPLAKLTDGDITQRVDAVLSEVASGAITPDEGKKLIGLLQAGFDITELPKLIEKLSEMETA